MYLFFVLCFSSIFYVFMFIGSMAVIFVLLLLLFAIRPTLEDHILALLYVLEGLKLARRAGVPGRASGQIRSDQASHMNQVMHNVICC